MPTDEPKHETPEERLEGCRLGIAYWTQQIQIATQQLAKLRAERDAIQAEHPGL